jgi:formylglycine-generating enzyme required for sulfatase activity
MMTGVLAKRVIWVGLLVLILPGLLWAAPVRGVKIEERRYALVIGNGTYGTLPLRNPPNDARDMAQLLKQLGFTVALKQNADKRTMKEAIRDLQQFLKRGGVGLFYYSGHGMQIGGRNYLIPVGAEIGQESDVEYEAVDAGLILDAMENAGNEMNIVILDSCRDNPFARSFRSQVKGLAKMDAPKGTFIAYSTAPGDVAADGEGRNSPYTRSLLKHLPEQGQPIEAAFKRVRQDLDRSSDGRQIPWEATSLTGDFFFHPGSGKPATDRIAESAETPSDDVATVPPQPGKVAMIPPPVSREKGFPESAAGIMDLTYVRGGCFSMGDIYGDGEADERPVHEVCVSDFQLGTYEVTVGQFRRFVDATGYLTEAERGDGCFFNTGNEWRKDRAVAWRNPGYFQDDRHPVVCVSWNDAMAYATWLGRQLGQACRLPTEAEREYAARSGGKAYKYSWGIGGPAGNIADESTKRRYPGWVIWGGYDDGHVFTAPVGTFPPNELGLYDMTGNVWEWCWDWYGERYYGESYRNDPAGPPGGVFRVLRGGAWFDTPAFLRTTDRLMNAPDLRNTNFGFRVAVPVR